MNAPAVLMLASSTAQIADGGAWLLWMIGAAVVVLSAGFAYMGRVAMDGAPAGRDATALDPVAPEPPETRPMDRTEARAFTSLARGRRLSKMQRNTIRRLAHEAGIPAPALMLSEHAFDTAASRLRAEGRCDENERRCIEALRSRLFAEA